MMKWNKKFEYPKTVELLLLLLLLLLSVANFQGYEHELEEGQDNDRLYLTKSKCRKCKPAYYRNNTDLEKCKECTDGSVAPTEGTVTCTVCPAVSLLYIVYFRSIYCVIF